MRLLPLAALLLASAHLALAGPMLPPQKPPTPPTEPETPATTTAPATAPAVPPIVLLPTTKKATATSLPVATKAATLPATLPATMPATAPATQKITPPPATTPAPTPATTKSATSSAPSSTSTAPATKKAPLPDVSVNFATPEFTLKTFAEAIRFSDGKALAACFVKPPPDDTITPVFLEAVVNSVKLKRAAIDTFGDDVVEQFEMPNLTTALEIGRLAALSGRLTKEKTSASLRVNRDITMTITADQFGATWLIEPRTFVAVRPDQHAHPELVIPLLAATAKVLADTRDAILAGKYTSVRDASADFHSNLTDATKKAQAATRAAAETKPAP